AIDSCVDSADFGDELGLRRVELDHHARVEAVDLLSDDRHLVTESLIERGNLLIELLVEHGDLLLELLIEGRDALIEHADVAPVALSATRRPTRSSDSCSP